MKNLFKSLMVIALLVSLTTLSACSRNTTKTVLSSDELTVAVSLVPQQTFVKAVGGDLVDVVTLIPPGHSPANYAPTPQDMEAFSRSALYFMIGVPTEAANILPKTKELNKNIKIVNLSEIVGEVHPNRYFEDENGEGFQDPHIWLSPRRVIVMVEAISKELSAVDEKNKSIYEQNAKDYIEKLEQLDKDLEASIEPLNNKTFIIFHPSLGYFAEDYGLEMLSIERSGKEATAKQLQAVINRGKKETIKVVFSQAEIDSKQTQAVADEIGGEVIQIEPLASNYIENMQKISDTFKEVLK